MTGPHKHASTLGRSRRLLPRGSLSRKKNGGPALTNHAAAEPAAQCLPGRALPPSLPGHTAPGTDAETQDTDSALTRPPPPGNLMIRTSGAVGSPGLAPRQARQQSGPSRRKPRRPRPLWGHRKSRPSPINSAWPPAPVPPEVSPDLPPCSHRRKSRSDSASHRNSRLCLAGSPIPQPAPTGSIAGGVGGRLRGGRGRGGVPCQQWSRGPRSHAGAGWGGPVVWGRRYSPRLGSSAPRHRMLPFIVPQTRGLGARAALAARLRADVVSEAGCCSEPGEDTINISAYLQKMTQPASFLKYPLTIGSLEKRNQLLAAKGFLALSQAGKSA